MTPRELILAAIKGNPHPRVPVAQHNFAFCVRHAGFCASDFHALYLQRYLHQLGLHFPDDIGLAGYNDDGYDLLLESPLTTMKFRAMRWARQPSRW